MRAAKNRCGEQRERFVPLPDRDGCRMVWEKKKGEKVLRRTEGEGFNTMGKYYFKDLA